MGTDASASLRLPDDMWGRDDVIAALAARDLRVLFRLATSEYHLTQAEIAAACGIDQPRISRIMNNKVQPTSHHVFVRVADGFGMSQHARGIFLAGLNADQTHLIQQEQAISVDSPRLPRTSSVLLPSVESGASSTVSSWPIWFAMQVGQAVATVERWTARGDESDVLQLALHREFLMFDAKGRDFAADETYTISRRQALATLAAMPLALTTKTAAMPLSPDDTDEFLNRSSGGLAACWHMLRGRDTNALAHLVPPMLRVLEVMASPNLPRASHAARLASQAHRILGIVALHRENLALREWHCKEALHFARISEDAPTQVASLVSLASTHFYQGDAERAATIYENANGLQSRVSSLQRARIQAELAAIYAQLGRESDALRCVDAASALYPEDPDNDPSSLFAEFTAASLILEQGLAYAALADHFRSSGYQERAAATFGAIETGSFDPVPERIRFEIANHQARVAVQLNDLDAFVHYVTRGIEGVSLLGSRQRERELVTAWRLGRTAWPHERRLSPLKRSLAALTS